jgi:endonuclease-3
MDLFKETSAWNNQLEPLLKKYQGKKHPLDYNNIYQLMVMVILSAQDSDANINKIAPPFFETYPNLESLAASNLEAITSQITKVRNFNTKASWLLEIAQILKTDANIPNTMESLTALKGIGRKSANVIMRESKVQPEGIIADLHVIRVAPRIGLTPAFNDGNRIEKELMQVLSKNIWGEIGMAISFLGRETCRPTNPKCTECVVNMCCQFYKNTI